jgi:hypothetical protein
MIPQRIYQFAHDHRSIPPSCRAWMTTVSAFAERAGYEYRLLVLDDLRRFRTFRHDRHFADLLQSCPDIGAVSDLVRNMALAELGGWWFDWDLEVIHPDALDSWLRSHADFEWSGIIDDENDAVASELQGGSAANPINTGFLDWLDPYVPDGFRFWAGPHPFTDYLRGRSFVDHRFRLVPVPHTFQANYREVKSGAQPSRDDPRPLFHHWIHAWIDNDFNFSHWLMQNPPGPRAPT